MSTQNYEGYPERWVWAACAHIYGGAIAKRTWEKYKRICKVPDFRKTRHKINDNIISKTHCQWLMMLAYIRFEQRRENGTKPPVGRGSGVTLHQIVKRLNSNPAIKQNLDKALGDAVIVEGVKGADVPLWLGRCIGRSPSIPTLRRWAKKHGLEFSTHKVVPPKTLNRFLAIA